jgi:hypothetical protein
MDEESQSRSSWKVSEVLWLTAWIAVALAALFSRADASSVLNVALGGGLLWAFALVIHCRNHASRPAPRGPGRLLVAVLLISGGCVEAFGVWSAFHQSSWGQVYWFAVPTGFAAAGLITLSRREPGDGVLFGQLFFHGLMSVPALSRIAAMWLARPNAPNNFALLTRSLIVIVGVVEPALFVTLLVLVAHDLQRPNEERDSPWVALAAAQAAYVVALFRWTQDGV